MGLLGFMPLINDVVGKVLDYIPDPAQRAKAAQEWNEKLLTAAQAADQAQTDVNRVEAQNASLFVAGWRPAIGWICAVCLGIYYVPIFLIGEGFWMEACWRAGGLLPRPDLGIGDLAGLLGSLLGIGTMRTVEKIQGVARNTISSGKL